MSETFKNPTPETLSGEKGPWMVTDMNLEKLGLIPTKCLYLITISKRIDLKSSAWRHFVNDE